MGIPGISGGARGRGAPQQQADQRDFLVLDIVVYVRRSAAEDIWFERAWTWDSRDARTGELSNFVREGVELPCEEALNNTVVPAAY